MLAEKLIKRRGLIMGTTRIFAQDSEIKYLNDRIYVLEKNLQAEEDMVAIISNRIEQLKDERSILINEREATLKTYNEVLSD